MQKKGLYHPDFEHDACGIGFIADISGDQSHSIIDQSLGMLKRLDHRAGHNGETGDGAGILTQIPDALFRKVLPFKLPKQGDYAVGMIFFPNGPTLQVFKNGINEEMAKLTLPLIGWRDVPININTIKSMAKKTCPNIMQVFIGRHVGLSEEEFDRKLYVLRRRIEKRLQTLSGFYIASLSARTIVYKGFLSPEQLEQFYEDLRASAYESIFGLVHSRFSTNTFPAWEKAHPYRTLIHNGEINTIQGNRLWMKARESALKTSVFGVPVQELTPIVEEGGSDSASLDQVLDFLITSGMHPAKAAMMLIPEPWEQTANPLYSSFYEYHSTLMEPWDGPMAIAFTDGRFIGAGLDRNGLRPGRYVITKDDLLIFSSEFGAVEVNPGDIKVKSHLRPGEWLWLDLDTKRIIPDEELKNQVMSDAPYEQWLDEKVAYLSRSGPPSTGNPPLEDILTLQNVFGMTQEEVDKVIKPMIVEGKEAIGSMGMDNPLAVLSDRPQLLYNYFKQSFAQVTNPPIDAIREDCVTSTITWLGPVGNLLESNPENARRIQCPSPILDEGQFAQITQNFSRDFSISTLSVLYRPDQESLEEALSNLFIKADRSIQAGTTLIILSDRGSTKNDVPMPMLLALSGLHHHLIREGTRTHVSLIADTGEARDGHQMAMLLGYGADAIHPYLGLATTRLLFQTGHIKDLSLSDGLCNFIQALNAGVTKIMSKLGVSTVQSYRGSQAFEALGIAESVINRYFTGTVSPIGGLTLKEIDLETRMRHRKAFRVEGLDSGSVFQWRKEGEYHRYNPKTIHTLQQAARRNDKDLYKKFASLADKESFSTLRSLLTFKSQYGPIPIEEVEPVESILKRFKTGAMSYGALSQEAHEALAIAMNRIGGKSNSGEGGEDSSRYEKDANGDFRRSAIKQVASGRFGVTSHYLTNADEIQIKMAQGAKPGEGGQLPAHKVYPWIAEVRGSTTGVGLISPPPHHDIYSIEDLAQLIYDLKSANPKAKISVKLVAKAGVGTIAAGVAKGLADVILISGYDGGTGASPRSSIQHTGAPWELGLAETHQTLLMNGLRDQVTLEADGKMMTGRDVLVAACLGAEEFGFSTAPLVVLGCIIMRMCHMDTCPVGIATQNPELRKKMMGTPEHVVNYLQFVAEDVRQRLAQLGFRSIDEIVGESHLLVTRPEVREHEKTRHLDLSGLLYQSPESMKRIYQDKKLGRNKGQTFDERVLLNAIPSVLEGKKRVMIASEVKNTDRAVGTLLGHVVTDRFKEQGLPEDTIQIKLKGSAGQSLAAFVPQGITIDLEGDANDYVGKGLSGGKVIIRPADGAVRQEGEAIIGNVAFYGATSGEAYIRGSAGGRFAVRNSGAVIVVEGMGEHGCEYMTGGKVVVLGSIRQNFAAGMSGGVAYILHDDIESINTEMVMVTPLDDQAEIESLRLMIEKHQFYTGSLVAERLLVNWANSVNGFVKVIPTDYYYMLQTIKQLQSNGYTEEEAKLIAFKMKKNGMPLTAEIKEDFELV
jgi:glutamate synthase (NADPH) large chain